jgi:hypothetical protein
MKKIVGKKEETITSGLGKPSIRQVLSEGLCLNKSPMQVMREEWERRKMEREKKYNK